MKRYLIPFSFLLILVIIILIPINWRFSTMDRNNSDSFNTFPQLYQNQGKPVTLYEIEPNNLAINVQVSGVVSGSRQLIAYVDEKTKKDLVKGKPFTGLGKYQHFQGFVSMISDRVDLKTGLHKVVLMLSKKVTENRGDLIPVEIQTERLTNRIVLPLSALQVQGGVFSVYRLVGEKVEKIDVLIGRYNKSFIEIRRGVKLGDRLVIEGLSQLNHNDKVKIIDR